MKIFDILSLDLVPKCIRYSLKRMALNDFNTLQNDFNNKELWGTFNIKYFLYTLYQLSSEDDLKEYFGIVNLESVDWESIYNVIKNNLIKSKTKISYNFDLFDMKLEETKHNQYIQNPIMAILLLDRRLLDKELERFSKECPIMCRLHSSFIQNEGSQIQTVSVWECSSHETEKLCQLLEKSFNTSCFHQIAYFLSLKYTNTHTHTAYKYTARKMGSVRP